MTIRPVQTSLLSPADFARRTRIEVRTAQSAFRNASQGRPWRGHHLPVVAVPGRRGGNGGTVWGLAVEHCDPQLRALLLPDPLETPGTAVETLVKAPVEGWQIEQQQARLRIIRPILQAPKGTSARAGLMREAVAGRHDYPGGTCQFSSRAIHDWIGLFERKGLAGLLPSPRKDRGVARVQITRDWDTRIDLPEDMRQGIADEIAGKARSMVANDGTSCREARRICEARLFHHCRNAGSQLPAVALRRICKLNAKWAERQELEKFRLIYLKNKDHKALQDKVVARISRDLHPVPMGLLIGDVHYVDLLVEENEEPVRVRLIHWMDASSLFVWTTPVFLSKGKGACQEDIAESLFQVTQCRHGGIPQEFYLDNGSEYGALSEAMGRLSCLADMEFGKTLARPYSPTSKGDIEGHFNILEHIFKGLPGWIGGDRTNKKTRNKGQVIEPYRRGLAALEADIQAAIAIYNDRPQSGRLDGLSPLEMLEQKIADTGFMARVPSEEAFDLIFSKSDTRSIRQSTITFDGRQWHTPAIDGLELGARIEVLIPLRKRHDRLGVRLAHDDVHWAAPLPVFQHGDREGARVQARLEKGRMGAIRKLEAQIDPGVSTFELQKAGVVRVAPDAPAPEAWSTLAIDKTGQPSTVAELEEAENARRQADMHEALELYQPSKARGQRLQPLTPLVQRDQ